MNPVWSVLSNAAEKPLADWGISEASATTGNQVPDTLRLVMGNDYKGAEVFPFGSTLELFRTEGGERRREFAGRVVKVPRTASGPQVSTAYELAGPWWYLQNKVYREYWVRGDGYRSRVVLTWDDAGEKMSAAATLAKVVNTVIAAGAPIAVGDLSAITGTIPSEEVANLTCAEVITRILRWCPDAVVWFDYNADPLPTLNITRAATAAVVDFSPATHVIERLDYARRDDVRRDGVAIQYERVDTNDGEQTEVVITDTAGEVDGFNALEATVSLTGAQTSWTRQYLRAETIQASSEQWLRDHIPELEGVDLDDINVVSSLIQRDNASITREVLEGAHAEWMGGESGPVKVIATIEYEVGGVKERGEFVVNLQGTSKPTGNYAALASETPSEPTPVGLAAQLFTALDRDHWEGSFTVIGQVAGRWDLVGHAVRLLDRSGAVLCGPAQVQGVTVDLATGSTTVSFGPTPILSAGDLVSLLRSTRGRVAGGSSIKLHSGGSEARSPGEKTANNYTGAKPNRKHVILAAAERTVTVDLTTPPPSIPSNLTVQLRAFPVCDPSTGTDKVVYLPCSEMVDP